MPEQRTVHPERCSGCARCRNSVQYTRNAVPGALDAGTAFRLTLTQSERRSSKINHLANQILPTKTPPFPTRRCQFFLTFRLAGSMPMCEIRRLRENYELLKNGILEQRDLTEKEHQKLIYAAQKKLFAETDSFLDNNLNEPYWLAEKCVAEIVGEAIHHRDGKLYRLHGYTIMPNHVHLLMTLLPASPVLFKVMQDLKKFTALQSNRCMSRDGQFWEEESYDHIVRSEEEFFRILNYILRNPVKAGFVKEWEKWPYTFAKAELL